MTQRTPVPIPDGVRVDRNDDDLVITYQPRWASGFTALLAAFCLPDLRPLVAGFIASNFR